MARIDFVVPPMNRTRFTGGIRGILEYANGFVRMGHEVRVIPTGPSAKPDWIDVRFEIARARRGAPIGEVIRRLAARDLAEVRRLAGRLLLSRLAWYGPYSLKRAYMIEAMRGGLDSADVTIATSYETALLVYLYGSGKKVYFAQHFEPYFCDEREHPEYAKWEALSSYMLPGIKIIANSSWLRDMLLPFVPTGVDVCCNGIRTDEFYAVAGGTRRQDKFIVISYGGRKAKWKGFAECAEAMRMIRMAYPETEWRVFGDALLPERNPVAQYTALGFLSGDSLRRAYAEADVLMSGAWYESFPSYPLEAMACGVAVVTTSPGVEEYARDGENAIVVRPRDVRSLADSVIRLREDEGLRRRLSLQAAEDAKGFSWEAAVHRLAPLLGLLP